jgi:hypothetical protein
MEPFDKDFPTEAIKESGPRKLIFVVFSACIWISTADNWRNAKLQTKRWRETFMERTRRATFIDKGV